jgi:hypothetical protein
MSRMHKIFLQNSSFIKSSGSFLGAKWSYTLESYTGLTEVIVKQLQSHENQAIQANIGFVKPETTQRQTTYLFS